MLFTYLMRSRYSLLATGWTVRGSNPGGSDVFRTHLDRLWGPPSLLYNAYRVYCPGVKRSGRDFNHPPPSITDVKKRSRVKPVLSFGTSWPVLGRALPLPLCI